MLPLPAFITSFTKVTTNSFDENDYLKNDIAEALIKSEEATEKSVILFLFQNLI